jgi:hypothetical protein
MSQYPLLAHELPLYQQLSSEFSEPISPLPFHSSLEQGSEQYLGAHACCTKDPNLERQKAPS